MPKQRYEEIYRALKERIEDETYSYQELLPSEHTLTAEFDCSRNTVRRAISMLTTEGYTQAMQGKGVRCIYRPLDHAQFFSNEIETFREAAIRNGLSYYTKVILFTDLVVDERIQRRTSFPIGTSVYYIQRVHYINDRPLILNHNYFLSDVAVDLTPEIAEHSIYDYLENKLMIKILNTRRTITVEKITALDEKYLDLNPDDYNCMAVVSSNTYNGDGVMFEYTVSRHRPDYFRFTNTAMRKGK